MCGTLMEVGSAETTLNGGSADPMPVCIGDAQINYFFFFMSLFIKIKEISDFKENSNCRYVTTHSWCEL